LPGETPKRRLNAVAKLAGRVGLGEGEERPGDEVERAAFEIQGLQQGCQRRRPQDLLSQHDETCRRPRCESSGVRAIRSYVRDERGVDRLHCLAIGYWRRGMTETAYHDAYDNDRDADHFAALREELQQVRRGRAPDGQSPPPN
jgi:hypothetical protein